MTTHTKGPWAVTDGNRITADDAIVSVAMLYSGRGTTGAADAALIAAAPELLQALRDMLAVASGEPIPMDRYICCADRARAAIARAEGQS